MCSNFLDEWKEYANERMQRKEYFGYRKCKVRPGIQIDIP